MRWVLATGNPDKAREWRSLLEGVTLETPPLPSPDEDGPTCVANAALKAEAAHRATGLPSLGDDVGLEVAALGGEPGVALRRWAEALGGWEAARTRLGALGGDAVYVCGLALADDQGTVTAQARVVGTVGPPQGDGPGMEACFTPSGAAGPLPGLDPEARRRHHHRELALDRLLKAVAAARPDRAPPTRRPPP